LGVPHTRAKRPWRKNIGLIGTKKRQKIVIAILNCAWESLTRGQKDLGEKTLDKLGKKKEKIVVNNLNCALVPLTRGQKDLGEKTLD
jgi:cytochrome c